MPVWQLLLGLGIGTWLVIQVLRDRGTRLRRTHQKDGQRPEPGSPDRDAE